MGGKRRGGEARLLNKRGGGDLPLGKGDFPQSGAKMIPESRDIWNSCTYAYASSAKKSYQRKKVPKNKRSTLCTRKTKFLFLTFIDHVVHSLGNHSLNFEIHILYPRLSASSKAASHHVFLLPSTTSSRSGSFGSDARSQFA